MEKEHSSDSLLSKVSQSIKYLRALNGLKQSEVAKGIDLSTRHYQKIESGQVDINASTVKSISTMFKVEPCYLLRNEQKKSLENSGILCPVEILDMLPMGVQINDVNGEISYLNFKHKDTLGLDDWNKDGPKYFIWDFMADKSEVQKLKDYLNLLVKEQPTPTPYITNNLNRNGQSIPLVIHWNYLFDSNKNVIGFLSLISNPTQPKYFC